MNQNRANLLAFLVAPLAPAIVFAVSSPGITGNSWKVSAGMLPIFYSFSMVFTLALGLPAFLALRRMSLIQWWSTAAVGAVIGALVASLGQGFTSFSVEVVAGFGAAVGSGEAMLFWLIQRSGCSVDDRLRL